MRNYPIKTLADVNLKNPVDVKILNFDQLQGVIGRVSKVTVYRWERDGRFPRRVRLGLKTVGWMEHEVIAWVQARPRGFVNPQTEGNRDA